MQSVKYVFEFNDNRELPEGEQGYAMVTLLSAKDQSAITDHLVSKSVQQSKGEVKVDYAKKSLAINKRNCPKVFNVLDPLTDELHEEISIEEVFETGQLKDLYEELSNVVGDINKLKEGIKKK